MWSFGCGSCSSDKKSTGPFFWCARCDDNDKDSKTNTLSQSDQELFLKAVENRRRITKQQQETYKKEVERRRTYMPACVKDVHESFSKALLTLSELKDPTRSVRAFESKTSPNCSLFYKTDCSRSFCEERKTILNILESKKTPGLHLDFWGMEYDKLTVNISLDNS